MFDSIRSFLRYARGLHGYFGTPLSADQTRQIIIEQLERRTAHFLDVLERGIYGRPNSAYRLLLEHAGITESQVRSLVETRGLEGALAELYDAGVYVTLAEFKGRRPVVRDGLEIPTTASDFDNPYLRSHYEARTSGSRGLGRRILVDLDLLRYEAAHIQEFLEAFDLTDRPVGVWYPVPPSSAGMKIMLRYAKLGRSVERWFSSYRASPRHVGTKRSIFTWYTVYASRRTAHPIPAPEYTPLYEADRIAQWLAECCAAGRPALLECSVSAAVRIALAAGNGDRDIAGTMFRLGGEPYTASRERVLREAGCRAACHYSMAETGRIGIACASPIGLDDVHLLTDKIAVLARRVETATGGQVDAMYYTTLHPGSPKIMLNVESGDWGVLEQRACGCPIGELGLSWHLSGIRSYDKLTSAGMSFLGDDLVTLVDDVLPRRFGGRPTHYQLVEEETAEGVPRVTVVVSPAVGAIDEEAVVHEIIRSLGAASGAHKMMASLWRDAGAVRVVRREPYSSGGAKILPLHVLEGNR